MSIPLLNIKTIECHKAPRMSKDQEKKEKKKQTEEKKQKNSLQTLRQVQRCRRVNLSFNFEYIKTHTDVPDFANTYFCSLQQKPDCPALYLWPLLVLKDTCSILSPSR